MNKANDEMRPISASVRSSGGRPEDTFSPLQEKSDRHGSARKAKKQEVEIHEGSRFVFPTDGSAPDVYPAT